MCVNPRVRSMLFWLSLNNAYIFREAGGRLINTSAGRLIEWTFIRSGNSFFFKINSNTRAHARRLTLDRVIFSSSSLSNKNLIHRGTVPIPYRYAIGRALDDRKSLDMIGSNRRDVNCSWLVISSPNRNRSSNFSACYSQVRCHLFLFVQ